MSTEPKALETLTKGIWKDNPIFVQILGICSALAVTGQYDVTVPERISHATARVTAR